MSAATTRRSADFRFGRETAVETTEVGRISHQGGRIGIQQIRIHQETRVTFVARPSIQEFRVPIPVGEPSAHYFHWVDAKVPAVRVRRSGDVVDMLVLGMRRPAIRLRARPTVDGTEANDVTGGAFVRDPPSGRFVFSQPSPHVLRISLDGFTPRLPKMIYLLTHSLVHEYVMWAFRRHMEVPRLEDKA